MLSSNEPYKELGGDYFNNRRKEVRVNVLTKQLEKLGYVVQLEPVTLQLETAKLFIFEGGDTLEQLSQSDQRDGRSARTTI